MKSRCESWVSGKVVTLKVLDNGYLLSRGGIGNYSEKAFHSFTEVVHELAKEFFLLEGEEKVIEVITGGRVD